MNIFHLDNDIVNCAKYHCDKHIVKMLLEYTQLLCTAVRTVDPEIIGRDEVRKGFSLYKPTHVNHPCAVWVREKRANFSYLSNLTDYLFSVYDMRYNKVHACHQTYLIARHYASIIPYGKSSYASDPPRCMPEEYKNKGGGVIKCYRRYYRNAKRSFATWGGEFKEPDWMRIPDDEFEESTPIEFNYLSPI